MINVIIIPADKDKPIREAEYDSTDYKNLTALIFDGDRDGTFDVMTAEDHGDEVSFWFDDNGLARLDNEEVGDVINLRAMELYCHMTGTEMKDYGVPLIGDYVITGGADEEGESVSVPAWVKDFPFSWHTKYIVRQRRES